MQNNYKILYLKYKTKYIKLKQSINNKNINNMTGGNDQIIQDQNVQNVQIVQIVQDQNNQIRNQNNPNNQINQIQNKINLIENIILKSGENSSKNSELILLTNNLSAYLIDNDIPINLKFNPYDIKELLKEIEQLKIDMRESNIKELYDIRNRIYQLEESNCNEILDYIIEKFKITTVLDINKLFSSLIVGYNKNYIIYYMVLLRLLIVKKIQLSVIENYIHILSFYSLKSCLSAELNSDEYLPLILNLIYEYINGFPIKKVLDIKKPSEFESILNKRQILIKLELELTPHQHIIKFDTKNKMIEYESGEIKEAIKLNFDDLIKILFNLFRISIPKPKPKSKINIDSDIDIDIDIDFT